MEIYIDTTILETRTDKEELLIKAINKLSEIFPSGFYGYALSHSYLYDKIIETENKINRDFQTLTLEGLRSLLLNWYGQWKKLIDMKGSK